MSTSFDRFETFVTTIAQINRSIQKIKDLEMSGVHLKGAYAVLLHLLGRSPDGLTAAQLCDASGEDKAAISRALAALTADGYIVASPATAAAGKRAYRTRMTLTERGREVLAYVNSRSDFAVASVGNELSEGDRAMLYRSLATIADNLKTYISETTHASKKDQTGESLDATPENL